MKRVENVKEGECWPSMALKERKNGARGIERRRRGEKGGNKGNCGNTRKGKMRTSWRSEGSDDPLN
jgi:hypothetical protein